MRHRRFGPTAHALHAPVAMVLLDLDELDRPRSTPLPLWSARRRAPVRFRRRDYLDGTDRPLARRARATWWRRSSHRRPAGRSGCSPTSARWGWLFNPISVYWCDADDGTPDIVVLEVTNTPWHERHWYVVEAEGAGRAGPWCSPRRCTSRRSWPWTSTTGSPHRSDRGGRLAADRPARGARPRSARSSTPTCRCAAATSPPDRRSACSCATRAQTMRVSAAIHRQALRLWAKRVPVVHHPPTARARP